MSIFKRFRSAITGRWVTRKQARQDPETTVSETVKVTEIAHTFAGAQFHQTPADYIESLRRNEKLIHGTASESSEGGEE